MLKDLVILVLCCKIFNASTQEPLTTEFRGVWIATVNNLDWPSSPYLPINKQKEEFKEILDFYQSLNFNAVIVQVRTMSDACYPSEMVPFSKFLSGKEGYRGVWEEEDPMVFMIDEAKKRDLEFHAWFNPFRSHGNNVINKDKDWIVDYGNKFYLNPGIPDVRKHIIEVLKEFLDKYEVAGIHFDDYFYPYRKEGVFYDDTSAFIDFSKGFEDRESWRRANIDSLIKEAGHLIHQVNPSIQFGVSPFGVWRNIEDDPQGSLTRAEQTTYDDLYANPMVWIENKWIDYLAPQLYWSYYFDKAPYHNLVNWWNKNADEIPIYSGNAIYKVNTNFDLNWKDPDEIYRQLTLNRSLKNVKGHIFFRARSLMERHELAFQIAEDLHKHPVLPRSVIKGKTEFEPPKIKAIKIRKNTIFVDLGNSDITKNIKVLVLDNDKNAEPRIIYKEDIHNLPSLSFQLIGDKMEVELVFIDQFNQISMPSRVVGAKKNQNEWEVYWP